MFEAIRQRFRDMSTIKALLSRGRKICILQSCNKPNKSLKQAKVGPFSTSGFKDSDSPVNCDSRKS